MSDDSIDTRITTARTGLEETLDELEDKFNVPKQAGILADRARSSFEKNPVPWIVGATAAAIAIAGVIAWAVLSDD